MSIFWANGDFDAFAPLSLDNIQILFPKSNSCHPGWTGPNCDICVKLPGCTDHGHCTKPMDCECDYGYEGHFCHKPKCREGCNKTTGFCDKPGECWCKVGWSGPRCETCVPYPGCVNGFCDQPWECKCNPGFVGMLCDRTPDETTTEHHYSHSSSQPSFGPQTQPSAPAGAAYYPPGE